MIVLSKLDKIIVIIFGISVLSFFILVGMALSDASAGNMVNTSKYSAFLVIPIPFFFIVGLYYIVKLLMKKLKRRH